MQFGVGGIGDEVLSCRKCWIVVRSNEGTACGD